jgi:Uma2 family endonuclease
MFVVIQAGECPMDSETQVEPVAVAEQRFLLPRMDWQLYEGLLRAIGNRHSIRVTYDHGDIELMSPLLGHNAYAEMLAAFVLVLARELKVPIKSGGLTTLRRDDMDLGLEPDRCFWSARIKGILGKLDLDLKKDPAPDLVIEVEGTRSGLDRMGIYAALGITEVWRFDGETLFIHELSSGKYQLTGHSLTFPQLPVTEIVPLLSQAMMMDDNEGRELFQGWVRDRLRGTGAAP